LAAEELTFDKALARLEEVAQRLESGNLGLEEALTCFQEGVSLVRLCNERLRAAEAQVEILMKEMNSAEVSEGANGEGEVAK